MLAGERLDRVGIDRLDRGQRLIERQHAVVERLLAADPRGDVPGVVHPQLEPAGQVALRLAELLLGDGLVAQPGELDEDGLERLGQPGRIDPGRDLEGAGVGVVDEPRRDVVGEAELLADGQEEAAAHPVAEDGVEHGESPAVGVVAMQRRDAEAQLGLAGVALARSGPRGPAGSAGAGCEARAPPRSRSRTPPPRARSRVSWPRSPATATTVLAGRYVVRQKSRIVAVGQGPDVGLLAADLATERAVTEHRGLEQHLAVLGRVVEVRADLLDDDRPLALDIGRLETRPDDELADDVHRAGRLAPRDADPVDRRLAVGRGVERAADALDRLADRRGSIG